MFFRTFRRIATLLSLFALALVAPVAASAAKSARPEEVRVVVVTTWEVERDGKDLRGELKAWRERWPFTTQLDFPAGNHPLMYDPKTHVLAIVTGMATARASASIMALGLDPRFDLSHAYWVVAGTAGVDPRTASIGSVAWAHWVVDGDIEEEVDGRDAPADWSTGILPSGKQTPFELPAPPAQGFMGNVAFQLNPQLVDWAYSRTRGVQLPDTDNLQAVRRPYGGPGANGPAVITGDGLMSSRFWYGQRMADWAARWVPYWTGGKGVFVMSAEEDTGILQALTQLQAAGRARTDRVLVLRAGSDYVVAPPGMSAADFIAYAHVHGIPANTEALDGLYRVAAPIVRALAEDWMRTRDTVPGAAIAGTR